MSGVKPIIDCNLLKEATELKNVVHANLKI
jgi:hypothetical protein